MRRFCTIFIVVCVVASGTAFAQSPEDLPRLRSERDELVEIVNGLETRIDELTTSIGGRRRRSAAPK